MSGALAAMMATVSADPNTGVAATWISAAGGPPHALRLMPSREEADAFAAAPMKGERAMARISAAQIPGRPMRGDLLAFDGQSYKIEAVEQDPRGVSYMATLAKV